MWWFFIGLGILTFMFIAGFARKAPSLGLLDIPNARSSHTKITPRGGGLAFVLTWMGACVVCVYTDPEVFIFWKPFLPAFLIAAIGFVDDKRGLSAVLRLAIQFLAAFLSIFLLQHAFVFELFGLPPLPSYILATLAIVWSTNLFNFMDGIDGFAGIEALFVLCGIAFLYTLLGLNAMVWLLGSLGAGMIGFLLWNWPPAKMFMGDVGSGFLGFVIAVNALLGEFAFGLPLTLSVLLFALFWFDATVTLFRRLWKGESLLAAHRKHAYQRALQSGIAVESILAGVILLNLFLLVLTYWVFQNPHCFWYALLSALSVLSLCYGWIEQRLPMDAVDPK